MFRGPQAEKLKENMTKETNVEDPTPKQPTAYTNWCYSCPIGTACADISEMEQAALHRMAKSIAQLTLCQVTVKKSRLQPNLRERSGATKPQKCHIVICDKKQQHLRKPRLPPSQEPQDHRVRARATFSQTHGNNPKASNDAVMWHVETRNRNWCNVV